MMNKKTHKIIGIFLIISLLFAEMYITALPAEDSFARDLSGQMAANFVSIQSDINQDAICTTESPAVHSMDLQSLASYQQRYREVHEFLSLPYAGFGSVLRGKSHIYHTTTYLFYRTQNERITEYVYQSDGKKRL